jgi:hypothetical protein
MIMAADATKEIQCEIQCLIRFGMIRASSNSAKKSRNNFTSHHVDATKSQRNRILS